MFMGYVTLTSFYVRATTQPHGPILWGLPTADLVTHSSVANDMLLPSVTTELLVRTASHTPANNGVGRVEIGCEQFGVCVCGRRQG